MNEKKNKETSEDMELYFKNIEKQLNLAYNTAEKARKKGYDPEENVDIPVARNMAERVEGLISTVAPQIVNSGMIKRIKELEKKYGVLDWRVALTIAGEVAKEKFCRFENKKQALDIGIRVGFAYMTLGIQAAPLEGFIESVIRKRKDGKEYIALKYAGPVRGAGGTAASVSVIIGDYVRKLLGFSDYDPTQEEINRVAIELMDYHERVTNLQYLPSEEETKFLIKNIKVQIDGDPTEDIEISNFKDLDRIETNRIRGGVCLVVGEGISQKAPKLWKRLKEWGHDFGLDWGFLKEFLDLQKKIKSRNKSFKQEDKITPNYTFISDLVAGRPVLSYPMANGGFRLRYGRGRTSGYSAASIHPATQYLLNGFIAIGTQIKVERPGKAAAITSNDSIEGPIIKLTNGDVIQINNIEEANMYKKNVDEILFLGDILFSYGDFSENGHKLVPSGYCEEWWVQELEKATVNTFGSLDFYKLADMLEINPEDIQNVIENPLKVFPSADASVKISQKLKIPLHPRYTYHWKLINYNQMKSLIDWLNNAKIEVRNNIINKIILPLNENKRILELIGLPHKVATEFVIIERNHATSMFFTLGLDKGMDFVKKKIDEIENENNDINGLDIVNIFSSLIIRDKSGTFIGARMGRPEKSKMRKLKGSPHVLFPIGDEGGRMRSFQSALEKGKVTADFPTYYCRKCNKETIFSVCENCGEKTTRLYKCRYCGKIDKPVCDKHGETTSYEKKTIDIKYYFKKILKQLGMTNYPDLIKGVKGTSNKDHTPEHLAKGILRAKHNINVNKDGTIRYDMTEIPITHFKPKEIGTSIEKLRELGYRKDIKGRQLEHKDQILELKPQDIILPTGQNTVGERSDEVLFNVANFIDELLVRFYKLEPFYNLKSKQDLVGHLVVGLAPHISAGLIGRIIGFSKTLGCLAHPMWHAGLRRDCDGDEACVILLLDALINFSRKYLAEKRGSKMDAPLVLTSRIIPAEVDDMVHGLDVVWRYPLELYEAALQYKNPWDIKIEQLKDRLGTERQYEQIGFTHNTNDINIGVTQSAYKTLPTMEDKLKGQMEIAEKVRAVNVEDVAGLVINKHFIKDIKGNLRKFSQQQFRCSICNEKYRRPPLSGKCLKCGNKIIFTVSEGSIVKYLGPTIELVNKYNVPDYLKQTIEILRRRVESVFGREEEKQEGLKKWFD